MGTGLREENTKKTHLHKCTLVRTLSHTITHALTYSHTRTHAHTHTRTHQRRAAIIPSQEQRVCCNGQSRCSTARHHPGRPHGRPARQQPPARVRCATIATASITALTLAPGREHGCKHAAGTDNDVDVEAQQRHASQRARKPRAGVVKRSVRAVVLDGNVQRRARAVEGRGIDCHGQEQQGRDQASNTCHPAPRAHSPTAAVAAGTAATAHCRLPAWPRAAAAAARTNVLA